MEDIKPNYTRVTSVFSPFTNFDAIPPLVLQNACERGTLVHKLAEMHMLGEYFPEPSDPKVLGFLNSFRLWHKKMVTEVMGLELRLYSDILRLTGAVDMVCRLKGSDELVIVDIKTPATTSKTWPLQLSAYAYLYNESHEEKATRRIALQVLKDGKIARVHEYTDDNDIELYMAALKMWRYFNG